MLEFGQTRDGSGGQNATDQDTMCPDTAVFSCGKTLALTQSSAQALLRGGTPALPILAAAHGSTRLLRMAKRIRSLKLAKFIFFIM